jgi:hypothetical protein
MCFGVQNWPYQLTLAFRFVGCLLWREAGCGDADWGDDRPDTTRASGQGEVDQGDREIFFTAVSKSSRVKHVHE